MTTILVDYRYLILVLFVVVSAIFLKAISTFSKKMLELYGKSLSENFGVKKINSQLFSFSNHPLRKVQTNDWEKWHKLIDDANLRSRYTRIFWLDNLWALLLILSLFAFGMESAGLDNNVIVFASILVSAYSFDLIENFTYLRLWEVLCKYMPWISWIKLVLYAAGFLWTLYLLVAKYI